jgi:hypothetical protein
MARFLIDANLPRRLSIWMSEEFDWVVDHDETWTDSQVWGYAANTTLSSSPRMPISPISSCSHSHRRGSYTSKWVTSVYRNFANF